jgi:hypothetical protein
VANYKARRFDANKAIPGMFCLKVSKQKNGKLQSMPTKQLPERFALRSANKGACCFY